MHHIHWTCQGLHEVTFQHITANAVIGSQKGQGLLVTYEVDLEDRITLRDLILIKEAVHDSDKQFWIDIGATQNFAGLWRNHEGMVVAPPDLLGLLIEEAHRQAHVAKGKVKRKITKECGFWAPYLLEQIDNTIGRCAISAVLVGSI